jgi:hypothetical protein
MAIAHSPYAPINIFHPQPVGICDRCDFKWPLARLTEQRQWAGPTVVGLGLLVCPHCLDDLQENGFRTIVIGPDPMPIRNPRPPRYAAQARAEQQLVLDDPDTDLLDANDYVGPGGGAPVVITDVPRFVFTKANNLGVLIFRGRPTGVRFIPDGSQPG